MADWFDLLAGEHRAALAAAVATVNRRVEEVEQRRAMAVSAEQSLATWEARSAELSRQQAMLVDEIATLKTRMAAAMSALLARCEAVVATLEADAAAVAAGDLFTDAQLFVGNDFGQLTLAQLRSRLGTLGPHVERSRQALRGQFTRAFGDLDGVRKHLGHQAQLNAKLDALEKRRGQLETALVRDHAVDQAVLDAIDRLNEGDLMQYQEELDVLLTDASIEKEWQLPTEVLAEMRQ